MNRNEYNKILKEYHKQKELEEYQKNRVLVVPKTTKLHVVLWALVYLITASTIFVIPNLINKIPLHAKIIIIVVCFLLFSDLYLRFLGIKVVECYQHYAKEETRRRCLCVPSCSEYAILCFKKFIFLYAIKKIKKRLFHTCKGDEYIVDWP